MVNSWLLARSTMFRARGGSPVGVPHFARPDTGSMRGNARFWGRNRSNFLKKIAKIF